MDYEEDIRLIIGLGNPGEAYKDTRHNAGFKVVEAFAYKNGLSFKHVSRFFGAFAQGVFSEKKVVLLKPCTFMNASGVAVRHCVDAYKIALSHLMVISDDTALPLTTMRIRAEGSAGGHNGLKSVETHLQTHRYPRLRMGIGSPKEEEMTDYVLDAFPPEESLLLDAIIKQAVAALELWITMGIAAAMQVANVKKTENTEN